MTLKQLIFLAAMAACAPAFAKTASATQDQAAAFKKTASVVKERAKIAQLELEAAKRRGGVDSQEYKDALAKRDTLEKATKQADEAVANFQKKYDEVKGKYGDGAITESERYESELVSDMLTEEGRKKIQERGQVWKEFAAQAAKNAAKDPGALPFWKIYSDKAGAHEYLAWKGQQLTVLTGMLADLKKSGVDVGDLGFGVIGTIQKLNPGWFGIPATTTTEDQLGASLNESDETQKFKKKYAVVDLDRAAGNLSADAVDMILRERGENSKRSQKDQETIANALYNADEFVDRQNQRVRFSQVVLRPSAQAVNRVYMTDRRDGDYLGLSIVSLLQIFNKALPEDWGKVASTPLNSQPLVGGAPSYYRTSESLSLRGPNTCYLCVAQNFSDPTQVSGQWSQAYTEQYNIQGQDRGFLRLDAAGNLLSGSDNIIVSKTIASDNQSVTFSYFNTSGGYKMFDATYRLVGQEATNKGGLLDIAPLGAASVSSWRGFGSGPAGTNALVEMTITAPNFSDPVKGIDFVLTGDIFKEVF